VFEREAVVPKGHLGQGKAERGLEGVALGRVGDGLRGGGDVPAVDVDVHGGYAEFQFLMESPPAPPQDLWSSILDSVSSTRAIPSKQVLVLGQPAAGKSLLASALLQKPVAADDSDDFALGYDWADVRDDGDEGASVLRRTRRVASWPPARYLGALVRLHRAFRCARLYGPAARFLAPEDRAATHPRHDRVGLDAAVDVHRRSADVAQVGRALGERGRLARGRHRERGEPRTTCVFFLTALSCWNVA
jgi:hypothetical protein